MMAHSSHGVAVLSVTLAALAAGPCAMAADGADGWQHTVFVYGMGAAIDGDAQIGPVAVKIDVSASDVLDNLEFGAMAAYRADNGTWSFTADVTFMGLGAQQTRELPGDGQVKGVVDVDQLTLMGTFGRRWTENLEVLFGLAYLDLSMDLSLTSTSGGPLNVAASRGADWVDPTVGLRYDRPLGGDWRLTLRGDIGGFGVGSDFMYHLLAGARWQASEAFGVMLGYRLISFDYEEGGGADYLRFDMTEQGPMLGVSWTF